MKNIILITALVVLAAIQSTGQTKQNIQFESHSRQLRFPEKCIGTWSGTMQIYSLGILQDSVKVVLTVSDMGNESWAWRTAYISEKMPVTKDYVLKAKRDEPTIFILDEGDGTELIEYAFANKLYSFFETEGVFLSSTYELVEGQLTFEVTSGKKIENTQTQIANYSADVLQRVVFKRHK